MCFYYAPLRLFHRATNPAQELFSCFQRAFNLPSRVFLEKKKRKEIIIHAHIHTHTYKDK